MEEGNDVVIGRPEELINGYVRLLTATANITSGAGTLALLWSTVVLLGGFVSVLGIKEFRILTVLISFLMAFRYVLCVPSNASIVLCPCISGTHLPALNFLWLFFKFYHFYCAFLVRDSYNLY